MNPLFHQIFEELPRQGPGDLESTIKAFRMLTGLPANPEILDVGCGAGTQTLDLAGLTSGRITALDSHEPFLTTLRQKIQAGNHGSQIRTVLGDMGAMDFPHGSFDLIWSEGASFIIGFGKAVETWRPFLRPNGYAVISDLFWFDRNPPQEARDYFAEKCPDLMHVDDVRPLVERAGYRLAGSFRLPAESWWTAYYTPLGNVLARMRSEHPEADAQALFDDFDVEIDMYRKYSASYGYAFYVMQRAD